MPVSQQPIIKFHLLMPFSFRERTKLKISIAGLFKLEKKTLSSLIFVFCTDEYLLNINQEFLQHNDLTDIITFDMSDSKTPITGEIYISIDRVKENARKFDVSFDQELRRVIFHGCLHLCGYKDKKPGDIKTMRQKESLYLKKSFA